MHQRDLYEDLCKYYEFLLGPLPMKEHLKRTIQQTVSLDHLEVFFLLPFTGCIAAEALEKKAGQADIASERLHPTLERLHQEGFILSYHAGRSRVYERGNPGFMTEQQVRKAADTPQRSAYAEFFNYIIEGATAQIPTKTPYFRTVPVESTLPKRTRTIPVGETIADPRAVLPLDVISEIVAEQELIGVAECYCRKAKRVIGQDCGHPLETCLVFNELAQSLIDAGIARQLDYEETMQILRDAETAGLVHSVDNCEGQLKAICNCCGCSCVLMKIIGRGQTNALSPSRYVVSHDPEACSACGACVAVCPVGVPSGDRQVRLDTDRCIGCGLCVSRCPKGALGMVLRGHPAKIYASHGKLMGKIQREAMVGLALRKVLGGRR